MTPQGALGSGASGLKAVFLLLVSGAWGYRGVRELKLGVSEFLKVWVPGIESHEIGLPRDVERVQKATNPRPSRETPNSSSLKMYSERMEGHVQTPKPPA